MDVASTMVCVDPPDHFSLLPRFPLGGDYIFELPVASVGTVREACNRTVVARWIASRTTGRVSTVDALQHQNNNH